METVAQSATWSDVTAPITNASGATVTNGLTGTPTVTLTTLRDSAAVDRRTGASLSYDGDGGYRVTKPIPADGALGAWWGVVTYNDGAGFVRTYAFGFAVRTAAQFDPVAALTNVGLLSLIPLPLTNTNGAVIWQREVP